MTQALSTFRAQTTSPAAPQESAAKAVHRSGRCGVRGGPGWLRFLQGGLGKVHQLFGAELPKVIEELNEALAA